MILQNLSKKFKEKLEAEKKYLIDGKRTIAKQNITTLSNMSLACFVLGALTLLLGAMLMPTVNASVLSMSGSVDGSTAFVPAKAHILFLPAMLVFFAITTFYRYKGKANPRVVFLLGLIFEITVYIFVIAVDIFAHPESPACFAAMTIIAFSAGIYMSSKTTYILNISFVVVYIFCDMAEKTDYSWVWPYDVFFVLIGFCIASVVGEHCRTSQIKSFVSKMRYKSLSMRDPLLENIYNKRGYEDAIDNYLVAKNPNVKCAFIVLDLNNFKHINDNYGHDMGDNILRCMSSTLLSLFRDTDIIGRFGGDEFIVLADGLNDEEAVEKKCRYIAELIGRRAQETGAIKVFSSLGAVLCDGQNVDFERLFQIADEAMYEAKEMGRDNDRFVLRHYTDEVPTSAKSN